MSELSWTQVHAWRLANQFLERRASRQDLVKVVTRLGGVQAQIMQAAELALGTRSTGLRPADVQGALWRKRSLVKTWAMRGTLHLLAAADLPLYVAARAAHPLARPPSYYTYHGVTPAEYEAILEAIPNVLADQPLTRAQLAGAVAKWARKPKLAETLLSGWGALLKPSAFRGDLCFGPNEGQNVTFVRPSDWIGDWQPMEPQAAVREVARRYLRAYGPATPDDFARWWGIRPPQAKKVFQALGEEVEAVVVEGWKAWALAGAAAQMRALPPAKAVRLLPQFDAYTLGVSRDCEPVLPKAFSGRVYRPQGWIAAVVLVEGRMGGTWAHERQRARLVVTVEMFAAPQPSLRRRIAAEAERLGEFLGAEPELHFLAG